MTGKSCESKGLDGLDGLDWLDSAPKCISKDESNGGGRDYSGPRSSFSLLYPCYAASQGLIRHLAQSSHFLSLPHSSGYMPLVSCNRRKMALEDKKEDTVRERLLERILE